MEGRDKIIDDIVKFDNMLCNIAPMISEIAFNDAPSAELLDLRNAMECLYLAFENMLVRDTVEKLKRGK